MKTELNFSWIIKDKLAASSIPNSMKKLKWLVNEMNINHIISLTESPLSKYIKYFQKQKKQLIFKYNHVGTVDGTGFYSHQFLKLNKLCSKAINENKVILIHCMGGFGRTSTALAAVWMSQYNLTLNDSINKLKTIRPQFMITSIQKDSLMIWEEYLRKNRNFV